MSQTETTVYCSISIEGVHCWPDCPFEEVAFLRDPHRHQFVIKAHKQVFHDDRDVEFIMLQRKIFQYVYLTYADENGVCQFGSMSCEMIADELLERFDLVMCDVSEDGENGAMVVDTSFE